MNIILSGLRKIIVVGLVSFLGLLFLGLPQPARADVSSDYAVLIPLLPLAAAATVQCSSDNVDPIFQNVSSSIESAEAANADGDNGEEFGRLQEAQVNNENLRNSCPESQEVTDLSLEMEGLIVGLKDAAFPGSNPVLIIREICNNGIDDDFDKAVDCDDPDCAQLGYCR